MRIVLLRVPDNKIIRGVTNIKLNWLSKQLEYFNGSHWLEIPLSEVLEIID